ncbi:YtpR family tRNA-binding protein [Aerococcaceae bacterium WGS1372]
MWIAFYNEQGVGDVLMLTRGFANENHLTHESNNNVTIVRDTSQNNDIFSVNIFNISQTFKPSSNGNVDLTEEQVNQVNELIKNAGFDLEITVDTEPKFVVGYVESCKKHEDSDHLSITQTDVGSEVLQIVCGANNIAEGMNVIVARPGAVMPSGMIIWPGELRGVESFGMICSTRELGLSHIEDLPGIWEVSDSFEAGTSLDEVIASYQ